jgi:hypothetical protein
VATIRENWTEVIFCFDKFSTFSRIYAKEQLQVPDPDFFIWETHIFFDDAFEPDDSGKENVVNQVRRHPKCRLSKRRQKITT